MTAYVYELIDPMNGERFYVGMTLNPEKRLKKHMKGGSTGTEGFISNMQSKGIEPVMRVLAECPTPEIAVEIEQALIHSDRRRKLPTCNNRYGRILTPEKKNHGKAWSKEELELAIRLKDEGQSMRQIAKTLGRASGAVKKHLKKRGAIAD